MDAVFLATTGITAIVTLAALVVVTRHRMPIAQGSRSRRSEVFIRRYRNVFATAGGCFVIVGIVGAAASSTALVVIGIYGAFVGLFVAVFAREELLRKAATGTASPPTGGQPPASAYIAGAMSVVLGIVTFATMAAGHGLLAVAPGLCAAGFAFFSSHSIRRAAKPR